MSDIIGNTNETLTGQDILRGNAGIGQNTEGINTRAFLLNLATGIVLFVAQLSGFFLLKSSSLGRRI